MEEEEAEELWLTNRNQYPIQQVSQIETLKKKSQTLKLCWICGAEKEINVITILTSHNRKVKGIQCTNCISIQKSKGVKFIKSQPIS